MIFIGPELSDPHSHFRTNVVAAIGDQDDLIIDLYEIGDAQEIFRLVEQHLRSHDERFVIYNAYEDEDFFFGFKNRFPQLRLITFFSDDEWRHANYDRYLALYSDVPCVTDIGNYSRYQQYGIVAYYIPWACNPEKFYPVRDQKEYNVSFIGAAYGNRVDYIRFLISNGVRVSVFGRGWNYIKDLKSFWGGVLTHEQMLRVISKTKINLNFLWTSASPELAVIKGRLLELAACKAFQLTSPAKDLKVNGWRDRENIVVFGSKEDMLAKVKYYLEHEDEREAIAAKAYEHVLQNHTWNRRFGDLFARLEKGISCGRATRRKYRILILARPGLRHQIHLEDERMDIRIVEPAGRWRDDLSDVDGVVALAHDSSISNETLYMMAFGLVADGTDVIAANFYAGRKDREGAWIRFRDRQLERRRQLLRMLPRECLMFSGRHAAEYGCELTGDLGALKVSYLEHPSFVLDLPYFLSRRLQLYLGHHRDARKKLKEGLRGKHLGRACALGADKAWQAMQRRKWEM